MNKSRRSLVYHQFRRNCISSATCCGISSSRKEMHADAWWDTRSACRPWWYAPHFVRRWYAKPAAWIKKERTFGRQKFVLFWWRRGGSNPWPLGCEPNALTNWATPPCAAAIITYCFRFFNRYGKNFSHCFYSAAPLPLRTECSRVFLTSSDEYDNIKLPIYTEFMQWEVYLWKNWFRTAH